MTDESKAAILTQVREYHREKQPSTAFIPGETPILSSGAVLEEDDRAALVGAALDMRIAAGMYSMKFERAFARYFGLRKAHLTNSGSSANLLALSALRAPELGDRQVRPGDEVITVAAGFPTTVNPIVQNGLVPVFVDVELGTYNTTAGPDRGRDRPRTRAIMIAHALGNPFEAAEIAELAEQHGLWLIEDNCDAVGSTVPGPADRHLRGPGHGQLLSGASHHHGRGRLRADQQPGAGPARRVVPGLGPGLLV